MKGCGPNKIGKTTHKETTTSHERLTGWKGGPGNIRKDDWKLNKCKSRTDNPL